MNASDIISKLKQSHVPADFFPDLSNWKDYYIDCIKLLHPDRCTLPGVNEANAKLGEFKNILEKGMNFNDDAGKVNYKLRTVTFSGELSLLKLSLANFEKLKSLTDSASMYFKNLYLPDKMELTSDNELKVTLRANAVPLSRVHDFFNGQVPQKHVNWILNRVAEFAAWMEQIGYVHGGINPDSIFIIPEDHGMICTSFYHMKQSGTNMTSISAKYANFYPSYLTNGTSKEAMSQIDTENATRTAVYLLGDRTGLGSKLRSTHNNELLDFYSSVHEDAAEMMNSHKALVNKHFKKEFHILTL